MMMMKHLLRVSQLNFLLLILFFGLFTTHSVVGQKAPELPFQAGEELTYKIYYNLNFVWVPAGEVVFKVWEGKDNQFHYQAFGRTYSSYEWFFQVDDRYESWIDKNTLLPNYSERSVQEGGYKIYERIQFDQQSKKMTVWRAPQKGKPETKTEHAVKATVFDVLSTMYYLRTIPFVERGTGSTENFSIFMDQAEYPLKMRYKGANPNKKVHGMGRYKTLRFQPDVIAGNVFTEDTKMSVWVSDDQNKIPVLIESPVSVGSVKVVLKSYKGLKYEFTAKVD
jgi:Protein of unknown function (DUF3108)